MVGLGDRLNNFPAQCSGGEQQRGAIARALARPIGRAPVYEDENALDYQTGKAILALLYDLCRQSRKTVTVGHTGALAPTADILIRMKNGKIESFTENPPWGRCRNWSGSMIWKNFVRDLRRTPPAIPVRSSP